MEDIEREELSTILANFSPESSTHNTHVCAIVFKCKYEDTSRVEYLLKETYPSIYIVHVKLVELPDKLFIIAQSTLDRIKAKRRATRNE